ncbi:MAG: hypothetical protein ACE5OR_10230 [bacterium]
MDAGSERGTSNPMDHPVKPYDETEGPDDDNPSWDCPTRFSDQIGGCNPETEPLREILTSVRMTP